MFLNVTSLFLLFKNVATRKFSLTCVVCIIFLSGCARPIQKAKAQVITRTCCDRALTQEYDVPEQMFYFSAGGILPILDAAEIMPLFELSEARGYPFSFFKHAPCPRTTESVLTVHGQQVSLTLQGSENLDWERTRENNGIRRGLASCGEKEGKEIAIRSKDFAINLGL